MSTHATDAQKPLWEGRYRATVVEVRSEFFACHRYIELNPVRAGLVENPGDYPWSSYAANALGLADPMVTPHEEYEALDTSVDGRRTAYRQLFATELDDSTLTAIRTATNKGWTLGSERFRAEVAALTKRRTEPHWTGTARKERLTFESDPGMIGETAI